MTTCPACGSAVDPLRAGEVAIIGGKFLYFCDKGCKADYFAAIASSVVRDDVVTAEPPAVSVRAVSVEPEHHEEPERAPPAPSIAPGPQEERPPPEDSVSAVLDLPSDVAPPSLVDERDLPSARQPASESSQRMLPAALSAGAVVAGLLTLGVPLLGSSALVARTVLGIAAAAIAVARHLIARQGWVTSAALVGAGASVAWTHAQHDGREGALVSFLALASVGAVVACELVAREREPVRQARRRIAERMDIEVRLLDHGEPRVVPCTEPRPGEQVLAETGEAIGVDGVVTSGEAVVVPWLDAPNDMNKREGDAVVAGASVVSGKLRITTTWSGPDRAMCKLALSPTSRPDRAAPLARLARGMAHQGAPLLGVLSGIGAFASNAPASVALGVGSATMFALMAESAAAAVSLAHARAHLRAQRSGVVYRDAESFDRAAHVDVAVVCARGTLLLGEPEIVAIEPMGSWDSQRVLSVAAALASGSSHPFAQAILRASRARGAKPDIVRNAVQDGSGATALDASGERVVLGRRAFLLSERVGVAAADARVSELEAQGRSALLLASAGKIVGVIGLQDGLRVGARAAVQRLLDARIEPVMLSGESRETCETIGRALDIEHIRPEVLAQERAAEVRALAEGGNVVAVLGHVQSDDAALGAAEVSIAMAAAGSAPGEWTVALASDDVRDAVLALTIPREARERALRALIAGVAPGVLAALGLTLGIVPPFVAALAALVGALAAINLARA